MGESKDNFLQDEKIDREKRNFLKKLARSTAFSVPVILSFSMNSVKPKMPRSMASG